MWIIVLKAFNGYGRTGVPGEKIRVPKSAALDLIKAGYAKPTKGEKENAMDAMAELRETRDESSSKELPPDQPVGTDSSDAQ